MIPICFYFFGIVVLYRNTYFYNGHHDPKSSVHCLMQSSDSLHASSPSLSSLFGHRFRNGFRRNVPLSPSKRSGKVSSPCCSLLCLVRNPTDSYQHMLLRVCKFVHDSVVHGICFGLERLPGH